MATDGDNSFEPRPGRPRHDDSPHGRRYLHVEWTESAFERGSPAGQSRWTAILTVRVSPPRSAEALRRNPLGIQIDAIDWSRRLDPPAAPAPPTDPILTGHSQ